MTPHMPEREFVFDLSARRPQSGVFMLAGEDGRSIADLTSFVLRLLDTYGEASENRGSGFLATAHVKAREVGRELCKGFGLNGMMAVHEIIDELLPGASRELGSVWSGIGCWSKPHGPIAPIKPS